MSGLSGVMTTCHRKSSSYLSLQAPPTSPLSFTTWCIQFLIYSKPACRQRNLFFFFSLTCMAYEKDPSPLVRVVLGSGFNSVLLVLGSHWLPNCFHISSSPTRRRCRSSRHNIGLLTRLPLFWLTTAAVLLCLVWTQPLTMLTVALNWQVMLTLIICLFLPFCSNYSSSARMTKYQHKVHSQRWLSSPKRVSTNRPFGLKPLKENTDFQLNKLSCFLLIAFIMWWLLEWHLCVLLLEASFSQVQRTDQSLANLTLQWEAKEMSFSQCKSTSCLVWFHPFFLVLF